MNLNILSDNLQCFYCFTYFTRWVMKIRNNNLRTGINLCFNCNKLFGFMESRKYFDVLAGISNICNVPFIGFVVEDLKVYCKITFTVNAKEVFETLTLEFEVKWILFDERLLDELADMFKYIQPDDLRK